MALTREQMDRMIDEHFRYESEDDVEGVLTTLAPDVIHDVVGWPAGPVQGQENARRFYEATFQDLSDGAAKCVKRLYGDSFVVDESIWEGSAPGQPFGFPGNGRPLKFRLLHVIEFTESGLIQRENVWLDLAAIAAQLAPELAEDDHGAE